MGEDARDDGQHAPDARQREPAVDERVDRSSVLALPPHPRDPASAWHDWCSALRHMIKSSLLAALLSALLVVGCTASARVHGSARVSSPDLVYVSPGVQVIANYREPIFYSDNYYWRYSGNVWYRSSIHTSGWVRYQAPSAIVRIERPSAYVYYRGSARASTGSSHPGASHATPAATRDERKEHKEEQKEERRDHRNDHKDAKRGHK